MQLRPYQDRGVADLRASYAAGRKAPLYVAPCGSGKTVLFAHITRGAVALGNRVWILVHRIELVRQASRKLTEAGVSHGIVATGFSPARYEPVQVCSVQTLARRMDTVANVDLIIEDECHHSISPTHKAILGARPEAKLLGVTATPERLDGRGLGAPTGPYDDLIVGPTVAELIDGGYLAPPTVFAPPTELDLSAIKTVAGDYEHGKLAQVMDAPTITGDAVAHLKRLAPDKPAVVFCVSVDHAHHVAEQFRAGGFRSACVDGKMPREVRDAATNGLQNGSIQVLTSCDILSEGYDCPGAVVCIGLRPTKSRGLWTQQWGRVMRPVEGKRAIILDHAGNTQRFGLPTDAVNWTLEGRAPGRRKQAEVADVKVRQCPSCYRMCPASATQCPECGEKFEVIGRSVEEVAGELEEITPEMMAARAMGDKAARATTGAEVKALAARATTRAELEAIRKARGYANGWTFHQMQMKGMVYG